MGDLRDASRDFIQADLAKTLLREGRMPCPYGAGECLISSPGVATGKDDGVIYHLVACSKARNAQDGMFGTGKREKELYEMGCPKPGHGFLSGWKCKYADGQWHPL